MNLRQRETQQQHILRCVPGCGGLANSILVVKCGKRTKIGIRYNAKLLEVPLHRQKRYLLTMAERYNTKALQHVSADFAHGTKILGINTEDKVFYASLASGKRGRR
jgi:hypothetical protein